MKRQDCIVLVTSCKAYEDVLKNFDYLFAKNWPDCPFQVWLNTDAEYDDTLGIYDKIIVSKHPQNLIRMRDIVFEAPYTIVLQDDHFLMCPVDTKKVLASLELAQKYHTGILRLIQDPRTNNWFSENENLMEYVPGTAYRISARGGLWDTSYLKKFIDKYDDFWEMERKGQSFSDSLDQKILCTRFRTLPITDAVRKGKYEEFARDVLEANDLIPERPVLTARERLKECVKAAIFEMNPNSIAHIQEKLNIGFKPKYKK
ncbi:hypothetical protein [Butyrivibrio fibrisolvens]|uniref:hypothetical protein n=1 Tax=Butyrivibrio fibrisolvens TaxID=831 RepID=UPI00041E5758|nr:hypothetical protein [Butyrivibrio fibrisolvens]